MDGYIKCKRFFKKKKRSENHDPFKLGFLCFDSDFFSFFGKCKALFSGKGRKNLNFFAFWSRLRKRFILF
ncbi:MAG: hypothetical protein DLD55_00205 [candidate division SR1 bacterium]|nr:MAG: hypothetical protein DLD55_00205 [candidate division SR1 bacterium]